MAFPDAQNATPESLFANLDPATKQALLAAGLNVGGNAPAMPSSQLIPGAAGASTAGRESATSAPPAPATDAAAMTSASPTPAPPTQAAGSQAAPAGTPSPVTPSASNVPAQPHTMTYDEFAKAHPAEVPTPPPSVFAGMKHPLLAKILTLLGAGAAEFGGRDPWGTEGRPGMGMEVLKPLIQNEQARREFAANQPAIQQQAQQKLYEDYIKNQVQEAQAGYYRGFEGKGLAQNIIGFNADGTPIFGAGGSKAGAQAAGELAKHGLKYDNNGQIVPETDRTKLPLPMQSQLNLNDATMDLKNAQAEYEKYKADPNSWMAINAKAKLDLARVNQNLRMNEYMINNYGHDMDGNVPAGIQTGPNGELIGAKFGKNFQPTTPSRSSAEFATTLQSHLPEFMALIDQMDKAGELGPLAGRWEDFMAGKVGSADNPDYATLRSFGQLFDTGLMKAHFGSKGGVEAMEHFQSLINAGKMDAATLKGSLAGIAPFLNEYVKMGSINTSLGPTVGGKSVPAPIEINSPAKPQQAAPQNNNVPPPGSVIRDYSQIGAQKKP